MPIYQRDEEGNLVPFAKTPFGDLERTLEDWVEQSPRVLLEDEPLAVVGRQVPTAFGKVIDLLAVDESGACVVIELKKGTTPREVIAQTMEYAAWVDSLTLEDLDTIAQAYGAKRGIDAGGVWDLYRRTFEGSTESEDDAGEARVTFNARQRLVIVAEDFPGEMEQTLRYLRARLGVDVSAVRFAIHSLAGESLIETEVLVGREKAATAADKTGTTEPPWPPEQIREWVDSTFLQKMVDGFPAWLESLGVGITISRGRRSRFTVFASSSRLLHYYFARRWLHFALPAATDDEVRAFARLSEPGSVVRTWDGGVSGKVIGPEDLELLEGVLRARVTASWEPVTVSDPGR